LLQGTCAGGLFILPAGFFFSPRDSDVQLRHKFLSLFRITKVKYFEETVFEDTTTTVAAFSFERASTCLQDQDVQWHRLPSNVSRIFTMSATNNWIIGGHLYKLPVSQRIRLRRTIEGQSLHDSEQQTFMTLNALDSGTADKRICLLYQKGYVYPAKECSRSYATLRISGIHLTEDQQIELCSEFNEFLEEQREKTWSLFLPQYRESKEYARKRIPFELCYRIVGHLLYKKFEAGVP
jgi:hypothetical protein